MKFLIIFKAAIFGWLGALCSLLLVYGCVFFIAAPDHMTTSRVRDLAQTLAFITGYSAIIAIPACFIAGCLVCFFLPAGSRLWLPSAAAKFGSLCGAVCIYTFGAVLNHGYNLHDLANPGWWFIGIVAAVSGAVCGHSLAKHSKNYPANSIEPSLDDPSQPTDNRSHP